MSNKDKPEPSPIAICPACGKEIQWRECVGFSTLARPCGHKVKSERR